MLDARDIQIAVDRQRHRPRDRRRRHDEDIGHDTTLFFECGALCHTEAMLLIRHHESEAVKRHPLLNQRVRSDDDVDLMCGESGQHLRMLLLCEPPREEAHADTEWRQKLPQAVIMLARKNLRRCHQRTLTAALHRLDEGKERNRRLARANVTLYEAPHGQRSLHIARDLRPDLLLILGQGKGKRIAYTRNQRTVRPVGNPLLMLCRLLFEREQPALDEVELLKGEPPPCRCELLRILWKVNLTKCLRAPNEMILRPNLLRQGLRQRLARVCEHIRRHLPQLFLGQTLRRRIDRQNTEMCCGVLLCTEQGKGRDGRERHLSAPAIGIIHLPREENALSCAQLPFQKALIEPDRLRIACPITNEGRKDGKAASPRLPLRCLLNHAKHGRARPCCEIHDARDTALILIGTWIERQEVVHGSYAEPRQKGCLLDADAAHGVHTVRQLHALPPFFQKRLPHFCDSLHLYLINHQS